MEEKPLASASRRLHRAAKARREGNQTLADNPDIILGMAAAGLSQRKIASALDTTKEIVRQAIEPHAEKIADIRDRLKLNKMVQMERVEAQMWPRIQRELSNGDAKDIDALARAAHAMEKIQVQVSGEGQKIDVKGMPENPVADIKALIQVILNDPRS